MKYKQKQTTVDKATDTQTDSKVYEDINKDSEIHEIYQAQCESSEGAQIATTEQQPSASDNLPKPRLDTGSGNAASGKPRTKVTHQRQAITAGIVCAGWLVAVGTVGWVLLCIILSSLTQKREKVDDIKRPNGSVYFESNIKEHI